MRSRENSGWPRGFLAIMDSFWNIRGVCGQCGSLQCKLRSVYTLLILKKHWQLDVEAWRWQLAGPFIPTVPLIMMVYLCPESPPFMIKHGSRYDHAFHSLCKLRNTPLQAAKEVYSAYIQQRARSKLPPVEASLPTKILELFTIPRVRRATTASYVVMLSQQLCGINIIAFYSSTVRILLGQYICLEIYIPDFADTFSRPLYRSSLMPVSQPSEHC